MSVEFAFVDVFADVPLTGNPLVVVPDADDLDVATMRALAREFHQSETTFLCRPTVPAATWRLRSFTAAGHEVGGAGHNALGAWLWLADAGRAGAGRFAQQIGEDVLPVEVVADPLRVVMEQSAPSFGAVAGDRSAVAHALGLRPEQVRADRPAQVVSTGAGHLLVPLADRAAVDAVRVDPAALLAVLRAAGGEGCYVWTADGGPYARFFNPTVGIAEDPATGTAAGPLAAFLVRHGDATSPVVVEQGTALGRPSRLRVDVDGDRVLLSGSGVVSGRGRIATQRE